MIALADSNWPFLLDSISQSNLGITPPTRFLVSITQDHISFSLHSPPAMNEGKRKKTATSGVRKKRRLNLGVHEFPDSLFRAPEEVSLRSAGGEFKSSFGEIRDGHGAREGRV